VDNHDDPVFPDDDRRSGEGRKKRMNGVKDGRKWGKGKQREETGSETTGSG